MNLWTILVISDIAKYDQKEAELVDKLPDDPREFVCRVEEVVDLLVREGFADMKPILMCGATNLMHKRARKEIEL